MPYRRKGPFLILLYYMYCATRRINNIKCAVTNKNVKQKPFKRATLF